MSDKIKQSLKELGFGSNEIKVYLALTQLGESPASQVAKKAGLPRTTTISILGKLEEGGYLTTHRYKGVIYYWIESPQVIQNIFANRMKIAEGLGGVLNELYRSDKSFPFAHIYDTKNGIKNFIEKTLINLKKKSIIYTIDTPHLGNYSKIFSDDFERIMVDLKRNKDIITKTLVPKDSFKGIESSKIKRQNIIIRELPPGVNFQASLWFVNNLLVFFSGHPPFVVAVSHKLIVDSMKNLFDYLWSISSPKN